MKNDYKRNYFYEEKNNFEIKYFFRTHIGKIQISKDIYFTCKNSYRKMRRDQKNDFQYLNHYENLDILSSSYIEYINPLDDLMKSRVNKSLMAILASLPEQERYIIYALFYENKSQVIISKELHISEYSVSRKKVAALKKLKKMIGNMQDIEF